MWHQGKKLACCMSYLPTKYSYICIITNKCSKNVLIDFFYCFVLNYKKIEKVVIQDFFYFLLVLGLLCLMQYKSICCWQYWKKLLVHIYALIQSIFYMTLSVPDISMILNEAAMLNRLMLYLEIVILPVIIAVVEIATIMVV